MNVVITGGCGFVGSNLCEALIAGGHTITIVDNLSTGHVEVLGELVDHPRLCLVEGDVFDAQLLTRAVAGSDVIVHLAANADVRHGPEDPTRDLKANFLGTAAVVDAMRRASVTRLVYASSGAVYGDAENIPIDEFAPFPVQTSFYGASKVAAEGLIAAHHEAFGTRAVILRLSSVLGPHYSHGHVIDLVRALARDPHTLYILGDGHQLKSYVWVHDVCQAILLALDRLAAGEDLDILNVAGEACTVRQSVAWICSELGVAPRLHFEAGDRGWVGDNPRLVLDTMRIRRLGWAPTVGVEESVRRTVRHLMAAEWPGSSGPRRLQLALDGTR